MPKNDGGPAFPEKGFDEDAVEWFLRDLFEHASPVWDPKGERVPAGTRYCGTLWITADGEVICADGRPQTEEHNCDAMGCSSASHVVARLGGTYR